MARSDPAGAAWLRDLLALVAATVLLAGSAYLALGLLAAAAQDGYSDGMRAALGLEPALPVRVFRGFGTWLGRLSPLILALPVVLLALRRVVRRSVRVGESWTFDLLIIPVMGAALAAVVVGVLVAARPAPGDDPFVAAGMAAVLAGLALVSCGFVALLLVRFPGVRVAVIAIPALWLLARAGADLWGSWRLGQYEIVWEKEAAAERAHASAEKRPVLRGEPRPDNAAPRYQAVFDSVEPQIKALGDPGRRPMQMAAGAAPGQPLTEGVRATLGAYRAAVSSLRDATRSESCDWQLALGKLYWRRQDTFVPRFLGASMIVLGHEQAQAKDSAAAASTYLDTVRFGADYGSGDLLMAGIGASIESAGLEAVGRLIVGGDPRLVPLAEVDRELGLLEGHLASTSSAYRFERLSIGLFLRGVGDSTADSRLLNDQRILPWFIPYRALVAQVIVAHEPYQRDMERALLEDDPAKATAVVERMEADFGSSWNLMLRGVSGTRGPLGDMHYRRARLPEDNARVRLRLSRFAIRIEQSRTGAGSYPADAPGLAPPVDPLGWPNLLHYEALEGGRGYKVWSVGTDGKDDGGNPEALKDVVLERRPR